MNLKCFDKITIHEEKVKDHKIEATYSLEFDNIRKSYKLIEYYKEPIISIKGIKEIASLINIVPAINYGLFANEIKIDFPVHPLDIKFFEDMTKITSRDIFVNKIVSRTNLIREESIPRYEDICKDNAEPKASINFKKIDAGTCIELEPEYDKSAVMVSGGKDSLTTYALLKEIKQEVFPFFLNEAGRHWIVSLKAYRYLLNKDKNTRKVWSNIDRLFAFIEKNMKIVVPKYWIKSRETYPIRLFWFEHYVFSFLPYIVKYKIGNVSLGNEYDDPMGLTYTFKGIRHYYGIYDQSQDFDKYMTKWFDERDFHIKQWSPIRPISGLIVEKILYNRYFDLFKLQTSCHSSHIENGEVVPCGKCSKCVGIMIFLLANGIDPTLLRYKKRDIKLLPDRINKQVYRLDKSELEHSLYLINKRYNLNLRPARHHSYVEMIHFDPYNSHVDNIPFPDKKEKIFSILEKYTRGYAFFKNGKWITVEKFDT